jgi:lipid-binding SYLF domain-containing protein
MKRTICLLLVFGLAIAPIEVAAERSDRRSKKIELKRQKIDGVVLDTLERLFAESDKAQRLFDRAHGYAVFDNLKISLGISGGGGVGVAVEKDSGVRTYMKMGTAGLNLGLGGQKYQVVFLFEDEETFDSFIGRGWQADASANAVAGRAGANTQATFTNGLAVYQLTEAGLMLQADISGTKYWKSKNLNR